MTLDVKTKARPQHYYIDRERTHLRIEGKVKVAARMTGSFKLRLYICLKRPRGKTKRMKMILHVALAGEDAPTVEIH